ncbi:hypothetical protein [Thiomicrorhabdus xiamenensis]|uniref:Class I SAM-dependent methyltransferase n=1 Tax=Thiomicrorhabdus xiamenensis TaxID=2739063 RepID=A0A7D4NL06_9GAMM|nr:hypothetical protein [Thiomicrorhabdus xiamenensis]QKI89709.1 hypothetical protein HQN79_09070 [Thiomicrorhabdus xiamenensis]
MHWFNRVPRIFLAFVAQLLALGFLALAVLAATYFIKPPYGDWILLTVQAVLAVLFSRLLGLPRWWGWIQLLFPYLLYLAVSSGINPLFGLLLALMVWLLFKNAFTESVPLYLSNETARRALALLAKEAESTRFIDLGCGFGANVAFMSKQPEIKISDGVETALLSVLLAKLRVALSGGTVLAQDIWKTNLSEYDLVYAFLSPQPMSRLWEKLLRELPDEAVFVSNSFAVPGVEPSEIWSLDDRRQTQFYIYKMSGFKMGSQSNQGTAGIKGEVE